MWICGFQCYVMETYLIFPNLMILRWIYQHRFVIFDKGKDFCYYINSKVNRWLPHEDVRQMQAVRLSVFVRKAFQIWDVFCFIWMSITYADIILRESEKSDSFLYWRKTPTMIYCGWYITNAIYWNLIMNIFLWNREVNYATQNCNK